MAIQDVIAASVSNSFGTRSASGVAAEGQQQATSVANSIISTVNDKLGLFSGFGDDSLDDAISAITALGAFRPAQLAVDFNPAQFTKPSVFPLNSFAPSINRSISPVAPPDLSFGFSFTAPTFTSVDATAPTDYSPVFPSAPQINPVSGAPVAPTITDVVLPEAPIISLPAALQLSSPNAPQLKELKLPQFTVPTLPVFSSPTVGAAPDVPTLSRVFDGSSPNYVPVFDVGAAAEAWADDFAAKVVKASNFAFASNSSKWAARGQALPVDAALGQDDYVSMMQGLINGGAERRYLIDKYEAERLGVKLVAPQLVKDSRRYFDINVTQGEKQSFEVDKIYLSSGIQLLNSVSNLYNARVQAFGLEVELYKVSVQSKMAELEKWKVLVDAENSKARFNSQLAQNYAAITRAGASAAEIYQAQVEALYANVETYKGKIEAFSAQAEIARFKLGIYKGKVDAYNGELSAYQAQFQVYDSKAKSVAAINESAQVKTQVSVAKMAAAGAKNAAAALSIELDAERLKLQARQLGATYENARLRNTLETVNAQIGSDLGKNKIIEWAAKLPPISVYNESIADMAQSAARYYNQSSDSAYRAAEQGFRALTVATEASLIAQESAAKAAASLAQGAYSALSVSAGLSGAGHVSGSEERSDRLSQSFSDTLYSSEERITTLGA